VVLVEAEELQKAHHHQY